MKNTTKWLLACLGASAFSGAWALDDMHWYKNEMTCADVKVTVFSNCQNAPDVSANSFCVAQKITFVDAAGKEAKKKNLLDKEPARGDFHVLGSIRCVAGKNNKPYLFMIFSNGGNCDTCEIDAVMDLRGKWIRHDKKWFVRGAERRDINSREQRWFSSTEAFYLENKIKSGETP